MLPRSFAGEILRVSVGGGEGGRGAGSEGKQSLGRGQESGCRWGCLRELQLGSPRDWDLDPGICSPRKRWNWTEGLAEARRGRGWVVTVRW